MILLSKLKNNVKRTTTIHFHRFFNSMCMHFSESKYSVESVSGKYLENGWLNQLGDFSIEFVIEKLTIFKSVHHHLTFDISSECIKFNGYTTTEYRDICMKVTP